MPTAVALMNYITIREAVPQFRGVPFSLYPRGAAKDWRSCDGWGGGGAGGAQHPVLRVNEHSKTGAHARQNLPAVLRIRIRIQWIHVFLGLPDPDPLVRTMDPDPDPAVDPDHSIIMQK